MGRGRTPRCGLLARERARVAPPGSGGKSGRGCTQCTTAAAPRGLVVQGGPARRSAATSACDAARLVKSVTVGAESPMAQWNLSGLVRTSDLPVASKTGSPARRGDVVVLADLARQSPRWDGWDRWVDSVEAWPGVLRASARRCAGWLCPLPPSAARRSAASVPTSPPPSRASPGCRGTVAPKAPRRPRSWAPLESMGVIMGLMMAGGRRATGGDGGRDAASSAPNLRRFNGRTFAASPTSLRRPSRGPGRRGRTRAARLQGRDSLRARFSRDRGRRRGRRRGDGGVLAVVPPRRLLAAVPPHCGARGTAWHAARFAATPRASLFPYSSRAHPRRRSESFRDDPSRFKSDPALGRQIAPFC